MAFNRDLGMIEGANPGEIELVPEARHEVAPGLVHFAVLATLGEVSAAHAVGAPVVPAQLSLQLLRRASSTDRLIATGSVRKAGRQLVFAAGEVRQGGEVVARVEVVFARIG